MMTKTKRLSTDSDFSTRYAAKYSVPGVEPKVNQIHAPNATAIPM